MNYNYDIKLRYIEIVDENITDLLNTGNYEVLRVEENEKEGVTVVNAS